jgi:hypothetical protein
MVSGFPLPVARRNIIRGGHQIDVNTWQTATINTAGTVSSGGNSALATIPVRACDSEVIDCVHVERTEIFGIKFTASALANNLHSQARKQVQHRRRSSAKKSPDRGQAISGVHRVKRLGATAGHGYDSIAVVGGVQQMSK